MYKGRQNDMTGSYYLQTKTSLLVYRNKKGKKKANVLHLNKLGKKPT